MKLKLTVDGPDYEVDVEVTQRDQPQPSYVPPAGQAFTAEGRTPAAQELPPVDEHKLCRSPVAGTLVRVAAQVGQTVQTNDVLLVLDTMGMDTEITSPVAGQIARVLAQPRQVVRTGQVLVMFL